MAAILKFKYGTQNQLFDIADENNVQYVFCIQILKEMTNFEICNLEYVLSFV